MSFNVNFDGPFYSIGSKIYNILVLNLIWLTLSFFSFGVLIPITTVGLMKGSYEALYGNGYAVSSFFSVFKKIKKHFVLYYVLPFVLIMTLVMASFNMTLFLAQPNAHWLIPIYVFVFVQGSFLMFFGLNMVIYHPMSFKNTLKLAFALGNKHFLISFLCLILLLASIFGTLYFAFIPLFLLPSIVAGLITYLIKDRVFPKYTFEKYEFIDEDAIIISVEELSQTESLLKDLHIDDK